MYRVLAGRQDRNLVEQPQVPGGGRDAGGENLGHPREGHHHPRCSEEAEALGGASTNDYMVGVGVDFEDCERAGETAVDAREDDMQRTIIIVRAASTP